jgi:PleD family two-component response regulator
MVLPTLFIYVVMPLVLIIFLVRFMRRSEKRANERLQLEKENIQFQQHQIAAITELNNRLTSIEKLLKEVD